MAEQQPRRMWRIVLVASLAINLAVIGAVGGLMLRSTGERGPPRGFDVGLGPIGAALSREDRKAIGDVLRNTPGLRQQGRGQRTNMTADLALALRAQTLSRSDLETALTAPYDKATLVRRAAVDALIVRVMAMTPEERSAVADRMERQGKDRR